VNPGALERWAVSVPLAAPVVTQTSSDIKRVGHQYTEINTNDINKT